MNTNKKQVDSYLMLGVADIHKMRHVSNYLTLQQKRRAIETLGYAAFTVLEHYFWKIGAKSFNFDDKKVATELGIPLRTVCDARLKLIQTGWVFQFIYRNHAAKPTRVTVVGEAITREYKKNPNSISKIFALMCQENI